MFATMRDCLVLTLFTTMASAERLTDGPVFEVADLRTEYLVNPLGIDKQRPRFMYEIKPVEEATRGLTQQSYRIMVSKSGTPAGSMWDSGTITSSKSMQIQYNGTSLESGGVYHWTVSVTATVLGSDSSTTSVSDRAMFTMGMLHQSDWTGAFIGLPRADSNCPWFRQSFVLPSDVMAAAADPALAYVTSVGYHELYINGQKASEDVLLPSISHIPSRVLYRVYNVTALLRPGAPNTMGIWAAPGWDTYGDMATTPPLPMVPLVLAELHVGATFRVVTDATWKVHASTTTHISSGFGGDAVDASKDIPGWSTPAVDDSTWANATVGALPSNSTHHIIIAADSMEGTRKHSTVAALKVSTTHISARTTAPHGVATSATTHVVEMAEVFTGWFRIINLKGAPGSTVKFEISTTAGTPMEYGMQDTYTFDHTGAGQFEMRFQYHEIQFITITGLATAPSVADVTGIRLTSLGNRTGDFSCSNQLITALYTTTVNNYRGLTTGGMTVDCPHRERRGYGGDGHTSYQFALANYPVGAYFNKWTRDFADIQAPDGWVPHTAPTVSGGGGPAWSGYVMTNPWQTYNTYGDVDILADMYPTMTRLLDFYRQHTHADDGLLHAWDASQWFFLGDWITPHGSESNVSSPENILFNNCYLHYITVLTGKISTILGEEAAAAKYGADAQKLATDINAAFGNRSSGVYLDTLQSHAVMPLATGVVPSDITEKTLSNLDNQITVVNTGHLDTGLTGTYFMTKYLMEAGRNDLVFTYANQTTFPSYGYFLTQGYTTWPESWQAGHGVSKMHGCYNGIGLWFVEGVAGIRVHYSDEFPVTIRAGVDAGDITHATGHRTALHGRAQSSWTCTSSGFAHNISIPGNGLAKVLIPSSSGPTGVREGGVPAASAPGVVVLGTQTINKIPYAAFKVASGAYHFTSNWIKPHM
eukprot:m.682414 g.682414  ORF g.682414 m.682414 type:complete len:931 (+) comp22819_c0_seq4:104-2896(+)